MQRRVNRFILASVVLLGMAAGVSAQQVYRIVGPDGRITFTDQPPPPSAPGKSATVATISAPAPGTVVFPLELREAMDRYPVTLFGGPNCEPCDAGRNLLARRGVPFSERTVSTGEDGDALKRMAGTNSLPLLTVGSQQVKGFSDLEWNQFLDAAGYPKSSRLPSAYRSPAPTPLVAVQKPAAPTQTAVSTNPETPAGQQRPPDGAAAPVEPGQNPAGIRF